jgi:hypothetical protein
MACVIDSWVPTASMTLWAPSPPVTSFNFATPSSPRSSMTSGGAELASECLAGRVPAEDDDPLGSEVLRSQHAERSNSAVADDGHRLAWRDLGRGGAEPPGAKDVGGCEQVRNQAVVGQPGVATSVPSASVIRAYCACAPVGAALSRRTHPVW